jgi:energy-coupling factor transport system permease protein
MNNITIGQYIPTDSWLHRLDPRIKILALVVLLVTVFIVPLSTSLTSIITITSLMVGSFILTISAKIPIQKVLRGLRPIVFLLTFTFFIQLLYTESSKPPLFGPFRMSISGLSILAIIVFLIFYNWSKRYIKFRMTYFILAVFIVFFIQAVMPVQLEIFSYQLPIHEEGLLRSAFIFLRIVSVIVFTSLLTFTTMTTELNYGIESLLKPL